MTEADKIDAAFMASYGWITDDEARDEHRPAFVAGYVAGRSSVLPLLREARKCMNDMRLELCAAIDCALGNNLSKGEPDELRN